MHRLFSVFTAYGPQYVGAVLYALTTALVVWLTWIVANWHRDRDERRNVGAKEQRIIAALRVELKHERKQRKIAEELADNRLGILKGAYAHLGVYHDEENET